MDSFIQFLFIIKPYIPNLTILLVIFGLIYSADRNKGIKFSVFDYFTDQTTKAASIPRTLQTIAGLSATWIVIKESASGHLTDSMFGIYLAAMGISEGWSKFISAKYSNQPPKEPDNGNA